MGAVLGAVVAVALVVAAGVGAYAANAEPRDRSADGRWTADMEANFMNACLATGGAGATRTCRCALDAVQDEFTVSEFVDMEATMNATGAMPSAVLGAAAHCAPEVAVPAPASPSAGLPGEPWSQERMDFVGDALGERFVLDLTNTRLVLDFVGVEFLCVDVAATNGSDRDAIPTGRMSAVRPSGVVAGDFVATTYEGMVSSHFQFVIPGATTTATKCFMTEGERGAFEVRYAPGDPFGEAVAWSVPLG